MSILTMIIYGPIAIYIVTKYRKQLDMQALLIIFLYFGCLVTNLGFSTYDVVTIGEDKP